MKTRAVNALKERYDVYIGRPGRGLAGPFGNPFKVGRDGTREECIEKYRAYFYRRLEEEPEFKKAVLELKGKVLGCFCVPLKCHGDVIVEYLESVAV